MAELGRGSCVYVQEKGKNAGSATGGHERQLGQSCKSSKSMSLCGDDRLPAAASLAQ